MIVSTRSPAFFLIIFSFLFSGCKGGSKVSLLAVTSTPNVVPVTTQSSFDCPTPLASSTTDTKGIGDGANSDWPDRFLTPTTFAIGIQSASLLQSSDTVNPITFNIFDRGSPNSPLAIYLDSTVPQVISDSSAHLPDGTYSTIQYQVVYYEMIVPVFNGGPGDTAPHCRRVRLYLANSADQFTLSGTPITAFDILFSSSDNGLDFNWISQGGITDPSCPVGQAGCLLRTRPANPYQLPPNRLPNVTGAQNIVTRLFSSPIIVDSSTDKDFEITLTFDLADLFFYDETDTDAANPNSLNPLFTDNFNFLASRPLAHITTQPDTNLSRDGSLLDACTPFPTCDTRVTTGGTATFSADFWPVPPAVAATVVEK